jgi:uncharacterized protein
VIVDLHTHVFPPAFIERRQALLERDATFAELYAEPRASLATSDDLLVSMDAASVDVSVALGFAWSDRHDCEQHNDYLLEASGASAGRIVPFCSLPLAAPIEAVEEEAKRCVAAGARGFGELRPGNLGFDLAGTPGDRLAALAAELDAVLLFHVSEPVGHDYAGKQGLDMAAFYAFVRRHPEVKAVGAHWGGGLPFYALMPEVGRTLANTWVDTAATSLLYDESIYGTVSDLVGATQVLFGSDYPLLSQKRSRARIEAVGLAPDKQALILGGNAARLLGLS